jgi:hypothetical protein
VLLAAAEGLLLEALRGKLYLVDQAVAVLRMPHIVVVHLVQLGKVTQEEMAILLVQYLLAAVAAEVALAAMGRTIMAATVAQVTLGIAL